VMSGSSISNHVYLDVTMTLTVDVSTMLSIGESSSTIPMSSSMLKSKSLTSFESEVETDAASSESKMSSGGQLRSFGKNVEDKIGDETSIVDSFVGNVGVKTSIFGILFESSIVATLVGVFPIWIVGVFAAVVATLLMLTTLRGFADDWMACNTGNGCCGNVIELKRVNNYVKLLQSQSFGCLVFKSLGYPVFPSKCRANQD